MSELDAVKSRWDLLRAVHPLFVFADTLPSVDGADEGRYGRVANVEGLKNEITTLRSDIKLNMIHQRQFDIDELRDEDVEELDEELYCLLEMFDGLVDDAVLDQQDDAKAKDDAVADFPRLNALRAGLRSYERDVPSDTRTDRLGLSNKISEGQMAQNSGLIHHPQDPDSIGRCKRVVARFGAVLRLFEETASSWSMEAQTQYYTDAEVQIIEEAHAFGEACTTLFNALAGSIPEGSPHRQVELHLSGFRRQGLGIRGGCQHGRWISATYHALPHTGMSAGGFNGLCACACANAPEGEQPSLRVAFNSSDVWDPEDHYEDLWSPIKLTPSLLDNLMRQRRTLKPMHRKLLGVFLACSLLQLYNSPWIQEQWERQTIHLPTLPKDMKQLAHWYPQVLCRLSPEAAKKLDSDDMAAFGVLLMELEADDLAPWTEDDVEWPSDEKSNRSRLARILREWEEDVGDEYRQVAKNCLDFQMLADSFEHSHLGPELGHLAILYKCVLDPLFRCLVKDFGKTAQLFQGIPGPWGGLSGAVNVSSSDIAKQSLFDDIETTESDER
ncbi:hypothetical protein GQ53DRAFT_544815 [Thozetella sp. PMI_491]|nr:hypothetical protein GQ53DRAFT_544815 [Thozetella sp. PMI_491]